MSSKAYNLGEATGLALNRLVKRAVSAVVTFNVSHPSSKRIEEQQKQLQQHQQQYYSQNADVSNSLYAESVASGPMQARMSWKEQVEIVSQDVVYTVGQFPSRYKSWWLKTLEEDPIHVVIETSLLAFLVYMLLNKYLFGRRTKLASPPAVLTEAEKEHLIQEWIHKYRAQVVPDEPVEPEVVVSEMKQQYLVVDDQKVLNMATHDFLGLGTSEEIQQASIRTLNRYGCGSCGPRGFYGTFDLHLKLEQEFAKFNGTSDSIMYSDGASAATSTVAAFCKRGDLIVADNGIHEPLRTGINLSRATMHTFQHNDMADLKRILKKIRLEDQVLVGRSPASQRRFLVVEGLYRNFGHVVDIKTVLQLCHEYRYRLIIDQSFSFATLGQTGRGVMELLDFQPVLVPDIMVVSLEYALGSIGGMSTGNTLEVIDHQRLSGAGYCFSASAPPFTAAAALSSLHQLETKPELVLQLHSNIKYFISACDTQDLCDNTWCYERTSHDNSCIVMLELRPNCRVTAQEVKRHCLKLGLAIVAIDDDYQENPPKSLWTMPNPSLRLTISALHTRQNLDDAIRILRQATKQAFSSLKT